MSTPKEQYNSMLDELDSDSKLKLIEHVQFSKLFEEVDPIAYRCGCSDFQATCDECHTEFWADDYDEEALCSECKATAEAEEQEEAEEEEQEEPEPECCCPLVWNGTAEDPKPDPTRVDSDCPQHGTKAEAEEPETEPEG